MIHYNKTLCRARCGAAKDQHRDHNELRVYAMFLCQYETKSYTEFIVLVMTK